MSKTVVVSSLMRTSGLLMIAATVVASMNYQLGHTGEEPKHRLGAWINQGRGEFIKGLKEGLKPARDFFSSLKEEVPGFLEGSYSSDEIHKIQLEMEKGTKILEDSIGEFFKKAEAPKLESENPTDEDVNNAIKEDKDQLVNAMKEGLSRYKEVFSFMKRGFGIFLDEDQLAGNSTSEYAKAKKNFVRKVSEGIEKVDEQLSSLQETDR